MLFHIFLYIFLFQAAAMAVSSLGIAPEGWSVVMDDAGAMTDCSGLDYVFDLVSELELCPAFPATKSQLLKAGTRHHSPVEVDHHANVSPITPTTPTRPQVKNIFKDLSISKNTVISGGNVIVVVLDIEGQTIHLQR